MNIYIPDVLVSCVIWITALAFLFITTAWLAMSVNKLIYWLMERRNTIWACKAYLTTRRQRAKADAYTLLQFQLLHENLLKENPQFLEQIRQVLHPEYYEKFCGKFEVKAEILGEDKNEAWNCLLSLLTQACESKQENNNCWPIFVSHSSYGKLEIVTKPSK